MRDERVVGLVLPHSYSYYRRILRGIAHFAEARPHWRFVSVAPEIGPAARDMLRSVDAAIVGIASRRWCDFLLDTRARIVNIDCIEPGLPVCRVGVDNLLIGQMAAQHFVERGIQSFAFAGHPRFVYSNERETGFRDALARSGHAVASYHTQSDYDYDLLGGNCPLDRAVGDWLKSLPRPLGLFTASDLWAAQATEVCREIDLRVPDDVAILGVDDDDLYCAIARPQLSSVIVPAEAIGRRAAAVADRLMSRNVRLNRDILLPPPGISERRSTDVLAISDPLVVAAVRFVRENAHRSLRVSDVLREVQISRRSLELRVFHSLGITLGEEIRRTRLEYAKRLLMQTELPIAEVATRSGFTDFRHLAVTFRHKVHQTPSQFRRERREAFRP